MYIAPYKKYKNRETDVGGSTSVSWFDFAGKWLFSCCETDVRSATSVSRQEGFRYFSYIRTVMPCWPREIFVPERFTVTLPIELLSTNL